MMRNLDRIELERLFYWILTVCLSAVIVILAAAIVVDLASAIVNIIRDDPNQPYVSCNVTDLKGAPHAFTR